MAPPPGVGTRLGVWHSLKCARASLGQLSEDFDKTGPLWGPTLLCRIAPGDHFFIDRTAFATLYGVTAHSDRAADKAGRTTYRRGSRAMSLLPCQAKVYFDWCEQAPILLRCTGTSPYLKWH